MVNTEIKLIIFATEEGEAVYSQQKQNQELTVAQIMNSLLKIQASVEKVGKTIMPFSSVQFSSVTQLCPTL